MKIKRRIQLYSRGKSIKLQTNKHLTYIKANFHPVFIEGNKESTWTQDVRLNTGLNVATEIFFLSARRHMKNLKLNS